MKKGFALLETIIVITFLAVSLLLLYGTFTNMVDSNKKNILYDDASDIYKAYYVKEYLKKDNLKNQKTDTIKELSCNDFENRNCKVLLESFNISKFYISKVDLKSYDDASYSSNLNNYLKTLSNNTHEEYRLIIEMEKDGLSSYASIGINGEENE